MDKFKWSEERHQIHEYLIQKGFIWYKYNHSCFVNDEYTHCFSNLFDMYLLDKLSIYVYPVTSKIRVTSPIQNVGGKGLSFLKKKIELIFPWRYYYKNK